MRLIKEPGPSLRHVQSGKKPTMVKMAGPYSGLAKQTFKPYEGLVAKFVPAAQ